jgi:hypothetical protein
MKSELIVYHHLGIGDHIICKGLIKELEKHYNVILIVKQCNAKTINFLYADSPSIKLHYVENDQEARKFVNQIHNKLILGHENINPRISFDQSFYKQIGLDINLKWTNFTLKRDYTDEQKLYNTLIQNPKYIITHIQTKRGSPIHLDENETKDFQIIEIDSKYDGESAMFSWLTILEKAAKIILTNSCILHIVNQLNINEPNRLYYKSGNRIYDPVDEPILRGKWRMI